MRAYFVFHTLEKHTTVVGLKKPGGYGAGSEAHYYNRRADREVEKDRYYKIISHSLTLDRSSTSPIAAAAAATVGQLRFSSSAFSLLLLRLSSLIAVGPRALSISLVELSVGTFYV